LEADMARTGDEARRQAVALASETMGEIVDFWGFKASMGRIWTLLYLSTEPLSADVIAEDTKLSAGAVSMSLGELTQWGLVSREMQSEPDGSSTRKRHYKAENDIWAIIRRIIRERELRLVARAVERFGQAVKIMEEAHKESPDDAKVTFMLKRLRGLLDLTRIGYRLVDKLADVGQFSLLPIRGTLSQDDNP
jgi:DNA-binding transcriptional regulator GbsR (MarR family)